MIHIVTYVCIYKHECGVVIWKITEFYMRSQNCQTFYANISRKYLDVWIGISYIQEGKKTVVQIQQTLSLYRAVDLHVMNTAEAWKKTLYQKNLSLEIKRSRCKLWADPEVTPSLL